MSSDLSESMIWGLTLIWEKFSDIIVSNISSIPFFLLLLVFSLPIPFVIVLQFLDILSYVFLKSFSFVS